MICSTEAWEKWLALAGRILIVVLLVSTILTLDAKVIGNHLDSALIAGVILAQGPIFLGLLVLAWRHVLLIGIPRPTLWVAFRSVVLAGGLNYIVPARLAELVKATYLRERSGIPLEVGLSAVLLERLLDLIVLALMGIAAFADADKTASLAVVGLVIVAAVAVMGNLPRIVTRAIPLVRRLKIQRFSEFLTALVHALEARRGRGLLMASLVLGGLSWMLFAIGVGLFVNVAGSEPLAWPETALLFVALAVGSAVPLFPGAIGTFEGAAVLALTRFGFPLTEAVALAVGLRLCNMAFIVPGSLLIALREGTGIISMIRRLPGAAAPLSS